MTAQSSTVGYGPSSLLKIFDGDVNNYEIWEESFMAAIRLKGLHFAFERYENQRPEGFDVASAKYSIYDYLAICLDRTSLGLIKRKAKDDGVEAMKELRKYYLRETSQRIHSYWRTFINCKMEDRSVAVYLAQIDETIASLTEAGEKISDILTVTVVLNGLPQKFENFVDIANQRHPPYKYEELKIALLNQEEIKKKETKETESVMAIRNFDRKYKPKCFIRKKPDHIASDCPLKKDRKNFNQKYCEYHKSKSHNTSECRNVDRHNQNQSRPRQNVNSASSVNGDLYDNEFSFHVNTECNRIQDKEMDNDLMLVDSGCTSHIEKEKSKFVAFDESFRQESHCLQLADGHKSRNSVKGIGTVKEVVCDGNGVKRHVTLGETMYISNFSQDILSVYKSVKSGHTNTFSPEGSTLTTKNGTVFNIIEKDKLYYIRRNGQTVNKDECNSVQANCGKHSLKQWHRILGHCNVSDIKKLVNVVDGMEITNFDDFECVTCILGKMTDTISRKPRKRATRCLDLVHCDLVGPINPVSREGYRYGINFVEDYSGAVKIYFLKEKSDAALALKKFIADTSSYGNICRLRCDNGTEFTGNAFRTVCLDNKIKMEFSSPRSPHQNGTAERNHRTIYSMARCLLLEAKLPKSMWTYAVRMAVNIRNRCFNNRTGVTPLELLTGRRPNLSKMNVFGTKCFAHDTEAGKLDPRCKEGVFVGHDSESPAYLVYFPSTQSVKRIRNVKFTSQIPEIMVQTQKASEPQIIEISEPSKSIGLPESSNISSEMEVSEEADETNNSEDERYPSRERKRSPYLNDYVTNVTHETFIHHCYRTSVQEIPNNYEEAVSSPMSQKWKRAMDEEVQSLKDNNTYELTELPEGQKLAAGGYMH